MTNKMYRQGDVILVQVDKAEGIEARHKELTIAYGEVTGHHHTLYPETKESFIVEFLKDNERFVELDAEFLLKHQEHGEIRIAPGTYKIRIEREYDPFSKKMRKVID